MLSLAPISTLFDATIQRVRAGTPVLTSAFYLKRPFFVPWSIEPTQFILETSEPSAQHTFTVNRTEITTIVPGTDVLPIQFRLVQGANRIEVRTPTQVIVVTIAATAIEAWVSTVGREIYLDALKRLIEVEQQLAGPWTTRISAHLYQFSDLFVSATMPRLHQTRLALVALINRTGFGDGVRGLATAVSYSTPWVTRNRDSEFALPGQYTNYPGVTTYPTSTEVSGRVLDLWYPNPCLAAKLALTQLALSVGAPDVPEPKPLQLIDISDVQLLLRMSGGPVEAHYLDPASLGCSNIEDIFASCTQSQRVFVTSDEIVDISMQLPQLYFDEGVERPLNFGFWDMGYGLDGFDSGFPGLGGFDTFDNVDPDDVFGDGFLGVSLSNRFDAPGCLDTRIQVGTRLAKYTVPLAGPTGDTPIGIQVGLPLKVDAASGAPVPSITSTVLWGSNPRLFLMPGDRIRVEAPDEDIEVLSAWPVFDSDYISANTLLAAYNTPAPVGSQRRIIAPPGFFTFKNVGMGIRVTGAGGGLDGFFSIVHVEVEPITLNSIAIVAGRATPLTTIVGPFSVDVYEPLHDRTNTDIPPLTGYRTFEVNLVTGLPSTLPDQEVLDYREVPRAVGITGIGATVIDIASDILPLPLDRLYLTPTTYVVVDRVDDLSIQHHTTDRKHYRVYLVGTMPIAVTDDQPLYAIRAAACQEGDPVTLLSMVSFNPTTFLVV